VPGESFYFDIEADGLEVLLGPTEARLMEIAWRQPELTVKQALFELGPQSKLAYTTVMTVLNRLVVKGLLTRRREGRNFVYEPNLTRQAFIEERTGKILACLTKNFPEVRRRR
jgi:predicted transcriptional regulator